MPLFNGNILQIHALLIAAYAGVAKGIANKGKKPDVCTTYPQQYENWYSMDAEGRSAEHTVLYNEWRDRVLRKLYARHGGAPRASNSGTRTRANKPQRHCNIQRLRLLAKRTGAWSSTRLLATHARMLVLFRTRRTRRRGRQPHQPKSRDSGHCVNHSCMGVVGQPHSSYTRPTQRAEWQRGLQPQRLQFRAGHAWCGTDARIRRRGQHGVETNARPLHHGRHASRSTAAEQQQFPRRTVDRSNLPASASAHMGSTNRECTLQRVLVRHWVLTDVRSRQDTVCARHIQTNEQPTTHRHSKRNTMCCAWIRRRRRARAQ